METRSSHLSNPKSQRLYLLSVIAALLLCPLGCRSLTSRAKGQTSNLKCESDVGLINGEMDAGVKVAVIVRNVAEAGVITVKPEVSTSEGEWSRSQELQFDKGESKTLTYFFEQPTINATNIQCRVGVFPGD